MKRIALFLSLIFLLSHAVRAQTVDSLWNGYLSPFVQTGGTMPNFTVQGQFVSNGGFTGAQISLPLKPRLIVYSSNKCYELPFTALTSTGSIIAGTVTDPSGTLSAIPSGSAIIFQPSSVYHVGPFPTGISASLQGCMQTYNNLKIDSIQTGGITPGDKQDIDVVSTNVWVIDTNAVTTIKIAANAVDSNKVAVRALPVTRLSGSGATNGQVLKWNSVQNKWMPGADNDNGSVYVPGTGIDITGNIITNTGATSINGEVGDIVDVVKLTDPVGGTGGDVTGSIDNMIVIGLSGTPIDGTPPTTGQVLKFDGTNWVAGTDATGGGGVVEPANQVLIGTGSGATSTANNTFNPSTNTAKINGTLGLRTTDTTGILNFVQDYLSTKNSIFFGGSQENIFKIIRDPRATTPAISNFNFVRSWLADGGSSGGNNQAVLMGYNVTPGGALEDISKAGMWTSYENNYRNNILDPTQFEYHDPQISYPDGSVRRVFSVIVSNDQTRKQGSGQFALDQIGFLDFKTNTTKAIWGFATGSTKGISFLDTARISFAKNNYPMLQQVNAANTAYIDVVKVNASNQVEIASGGNTIYTPADTLKTQFGLTLLTAPDQNVIARCNTFEVNSVISEVERWTVNGTNRIIHRMDGNTWSAVGSTGKYVLRTDMTAPDNSFTMSSTGQVSLGDFGTYNSRFDIVSIGGATTRLQEWRNSTGQTGAYRTNLTPNGAITGTRSDIAFMNDGSLGALWVKVTGSATNTGWEKVLTTAGTSSSVSTLMREESFTATAAQTAFTIAYTAPAVSGTSVPLRVYRNGVRLFWVASGPTTAQFTYSGTTVTTAANAAGEVITVEYLN